MTDDKSEWVHALKKHRQLKCPTEGAFIVCCVAFGIIRAVWVVGQDSANFKILFKANQVFDCKHPAPMLPIVCAASILTVHASVCHVLGSSLAVGHLSGHLVHHATQSDCR